VRVELPAGSRLTAEIALGAVRTTGRLGATRIKALSGGAHLDTTGDLWLRAGHGSIALGEVASGSVEAESGYGEVSVGVRGGVPAWLDLASKNGRVRNELEADSAPSGSEQAVSVRVRTQFGDIDVRRVP
jgi:hypothetical protein